MKDKRFVIRKYVNAPTAADAIQRESGQPVDEVYLENQEQTKNVADCIGFRPSQESEWRADEITRRKH